MCQNCGKDCEICGCPVVEDELRGEGCINGGCPTNKEEKNTNLSVF